MEEQFKIGDKIYCIDNHGVESELDLAQCYTVDLLDKNLNVQIFRLQETQSRWMTFRFTKDENHPKLIELRSKKYGL